LPFDVALCEQGRNFSNKVWNALRLVDGWKSDADRPQPAHAGAAVEWFAARLNESMAFIEDQYDKYRISDALMGLYKLIWDDFCSWYLEMVKPPFGEPIDAQTLASTKAFFGQLMLLLHPFMPFLTEEIWHRLGERKAGESIMVTPMPRPSAFDERIIRQMDVAEQVITSIRALRAEKNIPPKKALKLFIRKNFGEAADLTMDAVVSKLALLEGIEYIDEKPQGAFSFIVGSTEFFIPAGDLIDKEAELQRLRSELDYTRGFLASVQKKLDNERFVSSAPEAVVAAERKKQADAQARIQVIEEQMGYLTSDI
ncbi:MAG TPA: class I tRNA ligase family protein, partial [Bacteroidales bacterium]|nr:class I tRNA ligase family protein [Bacteroidales bacterium]